MLNINMDNILFLLLVMSVVAVLFMYKTLNEYRLNYLKISNENNYLKARIDDLKTYKNDVSKTFEILNNDLKVINEELKKTEPALVQTNETNSTGNQETVDISTINPMEVFSQYFFRPDNINGTNGNFRSNLGILNRSSSGNNVQNSNPLENYNYTDQILDTISRHLVNLS